jgi:hypothetical protein
MSPAHFRWRGYPLELGSMGRSDGAYACHDTGIWRWRIQAESIIQLGRAQRSCSHNSLEATGILIAESRLLYLPMSNPQ